MTDARHRDLLWDGSNHCRDCEPSLFPDVCEGPHHFALRFGDEGLLTLLDDCLVPGYVIEMLAGEFGEVFYFPDGLGWSDAVHMCWLHGSRFIHRMVGRVRVRSVRVPVRLGVPR